jgi:hypothetical protein
MPELSRAMALNPADRTVARHAADKPTRTGGLLSFADLLRRPPSASITAQGPTAPDNRLAGTETTAEAPAGTPQARARRDSNTALDPAAESTSEAMLDPLVCQLAVNQGPSSFVQTDPVLAEGALPWQRDLQTLLTGLVRRASWGGDRRKGSARIELSEGALAGATLVVHTEQHLVSVELELPSGVPTLGWQRRITERLEARGFAAKVTVG